MKNSDNKLSSLARFKLKLQTLKLPSKLVFILMGIASTLWFLVRVVPKPQRAAYPCMRAAAPIMSGFVLYLISIGGITMLFKRAVSKYRQAKYLSAVLALVATMVLLLVFNWKSAEIAYSRAVGFTRGVLPDAPNTPMGTGIGVNPGRVVWAWNPDATNEKCKNTIALLSTGSGWNRTTVMDWTKSDAYFMSKNNNNDAVFHMMDTSVMRLTEKTNVKDAWDAIFKNFNERKTGTASGYEEGQTVFIKINNGQAGWLINSSDLSEKGNTSQMVGTEDAAVSGTTPVTVLAIIRQLVGDCEIPQNKIYVGEPMTHVYKSMYDVIHAEYPDVIILDKNDNSDLGRTQTSGWTADAIIYSDEGSAMPDGIKDALMNEMYNADYLINIPALKAHARAGVSLTAKLHFGSHGDHGGNDWGSFDMHDGLICTVDNDVFTSGVRGDYGVYRVLTDLMGHDKLGGNTVLFVMDALWAGVEATDMPVKWKMAPFNNDFPSSLFISQDAVALESVCIDFLRAEATLNTYFNDRPFFPAVDDHLHQAASKTNWPAGIVYDPEGDGSEMPSMGVHEHWNNATDMQYTRNLKTGNGIELLKLETQEEEGTPVVSLAQKDDHNSMILYPNPCIDNTTLSYSLPYNSKVSVSLISANGQIFQLMNYKEQIAGNHSFEISTNEFARGTYICRIQIANENGQKIQNKKLIIK